MGTNTRTQTTWIKYDDRARWHITGLWDKTTLCGKPVTGDEESLDHVPWTAPTCYACERVADERGR